MLLQQTLNPLQHLKLIGMADTLREQQKQQALHSLLFEEHLGIVIDDRNCALGNQAYRPELRRLLHHSYKLELN